MKNARKRAVLSRVGSRDRKLRGRVVKALGFAPEPAPKTLHVRQVKDVLKYSLESGDHRAMVSLAGDGETIGIAGISAMHESGTNWVGLHVSWVAITRRHLRRVGRDDAHVLLQASEEDSSLQCEHGPRALTALEWACTLLAEELGWCRALVQARLVKSEAWQGHLESRGYETKRWLPKVEGIGGGYPETMEKLLPLRAPGQ